MIDGGSVMLKSTLRIVLLDWETLTTGGVGITGGNGGGGGTVLFYLDNKLLANA